MLGRGTENGQGPTKSTILLNLYLLKIEKENRIKNNFKNNFYERTTMDNDFIGYICIWISYSYYI